MMKKIIMLALIAMNSCYAVNQERIIPLAGMKPSNDEIIRLIKEKLNDKALRDLQIKEPFAGSYVFGKGWLVCVSYNVKNKCGKYEEIFEGEYLIKNGKISTVMGFGLGSGPASGWLFQECQEQNWIYD